ncbi:MAG: hypothetical protein LC749_21675 [Actinobacteria bacterium]|nr:hypothetical protein [Actinomycetota bacterium]
MLGEHGVLNRKPVPSAAGHGRCSPGSAPTYLLTERGLAECTAHAYVERARRFLGGLATVISLT